MGKYIAIKGVPPIENEKATQASKLAGSFFSFSAVHYLRPVMSTVTFSKCQISST